MRVVHIASIPDLSLPGRTESVSADTLSVGKLGTLWDSRPMQAFPVYDTEKLSVRKSPGSKQSRFMASLNNSRQTG